MTKSKEVLDEFDCIWIGYVIDQYDKELSLKLNNLRKKKKIYTDLVWNKLFKSYRKDLYKRYDEKIIKESILHIIKYYIEDEDEDIEICETLGKL